MECISYINDLQVEINILKELKQSGNCKNKQIDEEISSKEELIKKCKDNLSKLSLNSIEYRIYLKILNGMTSTKAVEQIAEENYNQKVKPYSISGVWNYYKKMKKSINL